MRRTARWLGLAMIGVLAPAWASAQGHGGEGHRHGPPLEAVEACQGAQRGASCNVTFDGNTIKGTCQSPDDSKPLACMPNDRPPGPPPEALKACQGKENGASCQMPARHGDGTIEGTCSSPASDKPLACRPNNPPPHP